MQTLRGVLNPARMAIRVAEVFEHAESKRGENFESACAIRRELLIALAVDFVFRQASAKTCDERNPSRFANSVDPGVAKCTCEECGTIRSARLLSKAFVDNQSGAEDARMPVLRDKA